MYEAVHAHPDGASTASRMALTAADQGYDGVVVRNHGDERADYDADSVARAADIDVVRAIEIRADDPSQASGYVGNYRPKYPLVCIHGGTNALNRFAVEHDRVDVLCHPLAGQGDFNHVLAKAARDHGVRVEFNFSRILRAAGGQRVQAVQGLRKLRELVEQYDAPYVVSADPTAHLHLRAPRELVAVGERIGFDAEMVREGLREWGRLAERNRTVRDERYVEPGVYRGSYDEVRELRAEVDGESVDADDGSDTTDSDE